VAAASALLLAVAGPTRLLRVASRGLVVLGLARRVGALASRHVVARRDA
jgi:hypothetical protein